MKFTCTQENLAHGLSVVSHIATKTTTLPILNNVLLKTQPSGLVLAATNLEMGVTQTVRGKVEEEGTITVQARVLSEFVSLLPKENLFLETKDQTLLVKGSRSHTSFRSVAAEEFPVIPTMKGGETFTLDAGDLRTGLGQVIFACAYDESRPEISGIFFSAEEKELILVGTDSYRLAERRVKLTQGPKKPIHTIVPARTLQEVLRTLNQGGQVTVTVSENQIHFSYQETEIVSRLIEGQYPDYQQILPKTVETSAIVEVAALAQLVKTASLFCKPGINDLTVAFRPEEQEVVLTAANSQVGESESRSTAKVKGKPNAITFNYRYLLDGLQNLGSASASLEMTTNTQPGVLKPEKEQAYTYLIMPIRQ